MPASILLCFSAANLRGARDYWLQQAELSRGTDRHSMVRFAVQADQALTSATLAVAQAMHVERRHASGA